MSKTFKALLIQEENGKYRRDLVERNTSEFETGDVLVRVHYSALNYKDALSAVGNKGVTRNYPHTPGIDASGIVEESDNPKFKKGDEVIVTSFDLGMETDGGFGQYIRVPSGWVIKLPNGLSLKESMIIGTAGLTAGMSILRLIEGLKTQSGNIVVSGATGGVGSMALAILAQIGFEVSAITGKESESEFLKDLGAKEIILRKDIENQESRPMLKSRFNGAIDTVGGHILENIIKSTSTNGIVTVCGLVASPNINLTVFPFILRGISVVGIDSQDYPLEPRNIIWNKLANEWKPSKLMNMYEEIGLDGLSDKIDLILEGKIKGRVLLNLNL